MRVIHWSLLNGSGMNQVAASMARGELAIGVDARLLDPFDPKQTGWEIALDADIHVSHTHIPEHIGKTPLRKAITKPYRWVFPVHGTPEHVFEESIRDAATNGYNTGTSFAQHQRGMQQADAIMAFVPRHRDLYDLATDKHTIVDLIPMGIDTEFWRDGVSRGKYAGTPSFLSCENQHSFKWSVYILRMWPLVREELTDAILHVGNLPGNIQRFVDVMAARYGAAYGAVYGSWSYAHDELRHILKGFDYYVSPVRYGDFNRMSLEAAAAGTKVISYPGNPYADYWIHEGDDRFQVRDLIAIGKGDMAPRADKTPVPTEVDMAKATVNVYERILDRPKTNWSLGDMPDAIPAVVREAIASAAGVKNFRPAPAWEPPVLTLFDGGVSRATGTESPAADTAPAGPATEAVSAE